MKNETYTENIKNIAKLTDKPVTMIYDIVAGRAGAGREMSIVLESACKALSIDCSKEVWMWGPATDRKKRIGG